MSKLKRLYLSDDEIDHAEPEPESGSEPNFEVGDVVIVNENFIYDSRIGNIGTILEIGSPYNRVKFPDGARLLVADDEMALLVKSPQSKFRVGDKVVIVGDVVNPDRVGTAGIITNVDGYVYEVKLPSGEAEPYDGWDLELCAEPEFEIGDIVEVSANHVPYAGKHGVVDSMLSPNVFRVKLVGGEYYLFMSSDLLRVDADDIESYKDEILDDPVNKPDHYRSHPSGIEAIEVCEHLNFNLGNVIKYVWRAGRKGDTVTDLLKARWYINREIERIEGDIGSK